MAFLSLESSDSFYYELVEKNKIDELKRVLDNPDWLKDIKKILILPTDEEIKKTLYDESVAYLSFKPINSLIISKKLPNTEEFGVKSKQQKKYNEDINSDLYNRFGMFVSYPNLSFKDLGGFDEPKKEMLQTREFIKKGLVQKNLSMFLGVSRSGKSFFAECLAGELKFMLIILDLAVIMCKPNPAKELDDFFSYVENLDNYVILIDEIEKVADPESNNAMSKVLIGKLLTIFNNFNSDSGFNIKANFVIATANNIDNLRVKNPEFINRFGLKYFVNYPLRDSFIHVCNYYLKKLDIQGITGDDIYNKSNSIYSKNEIPRYDEDASKKFGKYASGEIKEFMSNLLLFCEEKQGKLFCNEDILIKVLNLQKPQIQFAEKGVYTTITAAKIANFREVN